jgi:hypothetical protein
VVRTTCAVVTFVLLTAASASAQTKPTQAETDAWATDPMAQILESSPCRKITWLIESEKNRPEPGRQIHIALGWWGRGFIEGAVYVFGDKAQKAASDYGLSVDVVAAHVTTYCYSHQTETPLDGIQSLLLKVIKSGADQ